MPTILSTGYIPRDWQAEAHCCLKRHNILVFHRRGGKTVFAVNEIIDKALSFNKNDPKTGKPFRNPTFAFVATTIGQVEKIAWQYFKDYCKDIPGVKFNNQKLTVSFPHPQGTCTIYLFGAENFDTMRGLFLDGYVLDEFADMHPDVRDKVLLPTLSDRKGWEIIIGTPKGENKFKELYQLALANTDMWFSCLFKASETGILDDEELRFLQRSMSPEAYAQEYECDFNAAPSGKFYQRYIDEARQNGRVCSVPWDNSLPVITYWDLGHTDSTSIWFFQEVGREIRVIRYMEDHGKGLEFYVEELHNYPYHYSEHVLPHDADHTELSTGTTRTEYLESHGLKNIRVLEKSMNVGEDIHMVRQVLPKCWFDAKLTFDGLRALAAYERKWDPKQKVYLKSPLHNWASHAADSFRQFAVDYQPGFGRNYGDTREHQKETMQDPNWDILGD